MSTNRILLQITSIIVILTMMFSGFSLPQASAQEGDGVKREVNAETGKISFISSENTPSLLADRVEDGRPRSDDPAMDLARQYAPEFGVQNPEQDLTEANSQTSDDGRVTVKYQQKYNGIPIMGGELIVNTNDYGDLYSMNGEVSPNLSLSTQPEIDSNRAQETALQAVAKWHQATPNDFVVSDPELWIFDESLLKSSDRPVELVWRMEVTSRDNALPVRELVLVNAHRGGISLHFNQIDEAWGEGQVEKTIRTEISKPDVTMPKSTPPAIKPTTKDPIPNLSGNTWYVATTGNDTNDCATTTTPCATIQVALDKAANDDTILIAEGVYIGDIAKVNITKNITILGGWNSGFSTQTGFSTLDGTGAASGSLIQIMYDATLERFIIKNSAGGVNVVPNASPCVAPTVTLRQISITNTSGSIYNTCGTILLENSTISDNAGPGINTSGTVTILNSTIVRNDGIYHAGGINNSNGIVTIQNSILAQNTGYSEVSQDCSGTVVSMGNNIIGNTYSCDITTQASDQIGVDPQLGPLLPSGYHPLLSGSPAINAGNPATCLTADQRGVTRPQGSICDIGAYENATPGNVTNLAIISGNNQHTAPNFYYSIPFVVVVLDDQDNLVPDVNITFSAPGSGPSGAFLDTGNNVSTVISDVNGTAIAPTFTANGETGSYLLTASTSGAGSINFDLQNSAWYVATTGDDTNSCSSPDFPCATINGAINKATDGDAIAVAVGTYTGTGTQVVLINKSVTLAGGWNDTYTTQNGTSLIDGQNARRGVHVNQEISTLIDHFTIENGNNGSSGGGIQNSVGTMVVNNSIIRNNRAGYGTGSVGGGGGISNSGIFTLNNSTVSNNTVSSARSGSGIYNGGTFTLNNSTVSGNFSGHSSIYNIVGTMTLNNTTITNNKTNPAYQISGYGIENAYGGHVIMQNTIIAQNGEFSDCYSPNANGEKIISLGHNLIGNKSGCVISSTDGDIFGTVMYPINPLVNPLQNNGGITDTHSLIVGSPAINAGDPTTCLPTDQRGVARPVGAKCDIGAYEGSVPWSILPPVATYNANQGTKLPGSFVCDYTNPTCSSGDNYAKKAHQYAISVYDFYAAKHLRDSLDNNNINIISTVHYNKNYANAFWDGTQLVYGDAYGFPLADDIVAHEYTHGVTQYESNLFSFYQSGAISESLSDLWGEYYDQTNNLGNDSATVKWLLGEDVTGLGAVRNMKNPPQFGDPDKMTSPKYAKDLTDNGGIHRNSGVNNKAVYLMVDGGTFNGKTITKLGWDKTAAIYYEANTNLLTSGSDYSDLYFALQQACSNLIGQKGITSANCVQVKNTLLAVEMNKQPVVNFTPEATFCPNGLMTGPALDIFQDDFENGETNWKKSDPAGNMPAWNVEDWYTTSLNQMLYGDDTIFSNESSIKMKKQVTLPTGSKVFLHFNHAFLFDYYQSRYYDGGVLEYSINNGSTWKDAIPLFSAGQNYKGVIYNYSGTTNKLKGRNAFVGDSHGYVSSRYDLSSLAGKKVQFRWRLATDGYAAFLGWFVDDVQIYTCIGKPSKPVLSSPATNALVTDYTPDLDWSDSTPAPVTYQIQIADNNTFSSPAYSQKNLSTSNFTVPVDLSPNTKYYWRVRAINALNKPGAWSTVFTFRTLMAPPVLLTPTDGETIATLQPALDWEDVAEATQYTVQVWDASDFSLKYVNLNVTDSTYQIPADLPSGTALSWRVRALGPNGPSGWSPVFSFTTP